jgi:hypothetical protein
MPINGYKPMSQTSRDEMLSALAYQSWLDRGQPSGSPDIDWCIAEQKLAAQEAIDHQPELDLA